MVCWKLYNAVANQWPRCCIETTEPHSRELSLSFLASKLNGRVRREYPQEAGSSPRSGYVPRNTLLIGWNNCRSMLQVNNSFASTTGCLWYMSIALGNVHSSVAHASNSCDRRHRGALDSETLHTETYVLQCRKSKHASVRVFLHWR